MSAWHHKYLLRLSVYLLATTAAADGARNMTNNAGEGFERGWRIEDTWSRRRRVEEEKVEEKRLKRKQQKEKDVMRWRPQGEDEIGKCEWERQLWSVKLKKRHKSDRNNLKHSRGSERKTETKEGKKRNIYLFHVPVLDNPWKWQNMIHWRCDSYCRSSLTVPNEQFSSNTILLLNTNSSQTAVISHVLQEKKLSINDETQTCLLAAISVNPRIVVVTSDLCSNGRFYCKSGCLF